MTGPYRVPLRVDRALAPASYRLINDGAEPLHGVTALLSGPGVMPVLSPVEMVPGGYLDLTIRTARPPAAVVIRWRRANGEEYLWRVDF